MIVAVWLRGNRCWPAVSIEALRCRPTRVFRYRLTCGNLLAYRALRLPLWQRRHWSHCRPRGTRGDRRLGSFIAATESDIGEPLQQRHPGLLRMLLLGLAPGLPDFVLRRHRQVFELRHPGGAARRTFRGLRDERLRCGGFLRLGPRDAMVGK